MGEDGAVPDKTRRFERGYPKELRERGVRMLVESADLERENRELSRANEILKAASAFFARELDARSPRWPFHLMATKGRFGVEPMLLDAAGCPVELPRGQDARPVAASASR